MICDHSYIDTPPDLSDDEDEEKQTYFMPESTAMFAEDVASTAMRLDSYAEWVEAKEEELRYMEV